MSTMREDFEAAIETSGLEAEDENALQETEQVVDQADDVPLDAAGDDAHHPETSPEVEELSSSPADAEQKTNIKDADEKSEQKTADNEQDSIKAPLDWSPKQRESWSKVPRAIQDKVIAREQEMAQAMQGTAEARKTHDHLARLGQSFAPVIGAEGFNSPMEAVEGFFNTVAELRMGSPAQKATKIAQLIQHYGVDIQALDSVLVGQAPKSSPNAEMEQLIDQRMAPINQVMQQLGTMQQNKQQATQQNANASVQAFGEKAEFLNDVRMDMADLIDMAAKQGRELTLEQAYDRACALNPEVSQILETRKKEERILGSSNSIAAKRNAASGLNGRMTGGTGAPSSQSLRDTISNAWDEAGQ